MVFDVGAITARFGEQDTREFVEHTGSSLRFGANIEGETIFVKNVEFIDKSEEPKMPEPVFKVGGGGTVSAYYENNDFITVGTSAHQWNGRLFFSDAVWTEYLAAQTAGGKVMRMEIKFGTSVSLSGYIGTSNNDLNNYRADARYFRFYDENGNAVAYSDLSAETWYTLDLDIDAISTIEEQGWQNEGANSTLKFARESEGTISVKNVEFVDKNEM